MNRTDLVQLTLPPKSWAGEEWLKRHDPVYECNYMTNFERKLMGYRKKPDAPRPEWWGKPAVLIRGVRL